MRKERFYSIFLNPDRVFLVPIQYKIVVALLKNGALARRDFVKILNTPRTTVYDNLLKLQKKKIVEKFSRNIGMRGRPIVYWKLKDNIDYSNVEVTYLNM